MSGHAAWYTRRMSRCPGFRTAAALLLAIHCFAHPLYAKPAAAELHSKYEALSREFGDANPDWRPKPPASGALLFVASDEYSPAEQASQQDREARNKYADSLFNFAKQAAEIGETSLAFKCATEVVREKPEH